MSYQITFVPTIEKMNEYKPWANSSNTKWEEIVNNTKQEIVSYCMKSHDEQTSAIIKNLTLSLNTLFYAVQEQERVNAYKRWSEDKDHELWYCGWEFSRECDYDKNEVINNYVDKLLVFADIVPTPDFFDDYEKFCNKLEKVKEHLDSFIEFSETIAIHGIIKDLKVFKVKENEEIDEPGKDFLEEDKEEYD